MVDTESNYREKLDDLDDLEGEETNLIDVADVSEALTEEQAAAAAQRRKKLKIDYNKSEPSFSRMPVTSEATIAKLSDRFAAFWIDTTILFYAYMLAAFLYRRILFDTWLGPLPLLGFHGLVFNGSFAIIAFLYYFVFEGIFFATIGKAICGLVIRRSDGGLASMLSIFSRNVFRVVDYLLCGFVALFFMEMTKSSQRLGDIVAGTTVLKKGRQAKEPYHVSIANIASASGRTIALLIDMAIFLCLLAGILLFLTPDKRLIGQWIILLLPLAALLYFTLIETITETTPGKFLLGYIITFEDGNRITFSASLIRTLLRPIDFVIGIAPMALSPKKQRIGDLCAGTIVTKQRRSIKGLIGLGVALALSSGTMALAWQTPKNLRTADFEFNFMPDIGVNWGPFVSGQKQYKQMAIKNFRFAVGDPKNIRTPAVYSPGEKAYILFEVVGYQRDKRKVWLQEDLTVRYPDLTIGLKQDNMIDYNKVVKSDAPIELVNEVSLPVTAAPGRYNVTVTVRDILAGKQISEQIPFSVRLPLPETQVQPPPLGAEIPTPSGPVAPVGIPALPSGPLPPEAAAPQIPGAVTMPQALPALPATAPAVTPPTLPLITATPPAVAPTTTPQAIPILPPTTTPLPATPPAAPAVPPATGPVPPAIPATPPAAPAGAMPGLTLDQQAGTSKAVAPAIPPSQPAALTPPGTMPTPVTPAVPGTLTPPAIPTTPGASPAPIPALPAVPAPVAPPATPSSLSPKGPTITPLTPPAPSKETLKGQPAAEATKSAQPADAQQPKSMLQGAEIKVPISETPMTTLTAPAAEPIAPAPAPAPAAATQPPTATPQVPAPAQAAPVPTPSIPPPAAAPAPTTVPQPTPPAVTPTPLAPITPTPTIPPSAAPAPTPIPTLPAPTLPAPALTKPVVPAPAAAGAATPPTTPPSTVPNLLPGPSKAPAPVIPPKVLPQAPATPEPAKAVTPSATPVPKPTTPAALPPKVTTPPVVEKPKEPAKPVTPAVKPEEKKPATSATPAAPKTSTPPAVEKPKEQPKPVVKPEEKKPAAAAPVEKKPVTPVIKPTPAPTPSTPVITAPPIKPGAESGIIEKSLPPESAKPPVTTPPTPTTPKVEKKSEEVQKKSMAKAPATSQPAMTPTTTEPSATTTETTKKPKAEVKGSASPANDKAPSPESRSLDLDY